uniref:Phorbol-ester/DAG-type domain-containing protein n=1 Tax=Fagus sylvatica TaxID=28930 RepID=A0A2N9EEA5_FAGSY
MEIQHFSHGHPLVFNEDERSGCLCYGCSEPVLGPSYSCIQCKRFYHHKSCAELPRELHHPFHPKHPLILGEYYDYKGKCQVCEEYRLTYSYGCSDCNFNLHSRCAFPLTMETELHDHPLTCIWKFVKFTCDLCGKEGNARPYLCAPCNFWIHKSCGSCLRRVKVIRHKHPLNLIHSLEVNQSDSRFCQLCVQKVDTDYGLYYCLICDFVAHLDCAMAERNREELKDEEFENEDSELDESVDLETYKVKKIILGEDGTEIATEIEHFTHEHDLKLTDEVLNHEKCDGCARAILPPFYSCGFGVMPVASIAMASPTDVRNAILISMFNVV